MATCRLFARIPGNRLTRSFCVGQLPASHPFGTRLTWHGQLNAGLLDLGPDALIAGRSAAALHGLDHFAPGPLEFVVPRDHRDRRTVGVVRATSTIPRLDRARVDGLAVTSAALTIIQLAAHTSRHDVANALDSAIQLGLTTPDVVRRRFAAHRHRGLPGTALLDDVLAEAGVQSYLERRFLRLVRAAGLPEPALQRVYRRGTRHVAPVDFDFAPLPVIVEVGGPKGYLTGRERQRQERRRSQLQLLGKVIYVFTNEDVADDSSYVVTTLRAALDVAA
ncbi:MAG TPA: type IV toxin-antitoxin system AbiEi family antitoxin [Acidimicrobiales bacterium]|nr:type IV toxin-antitoxin system AbiEi family antitoxin [Acidimicrobiales bacterium]